MQIQQLGYLLHHLPVVLDRQSDQVLQERLGIGLAQFKVLMCLEWTNSVQQRYIAERLGQTEASISRQIKLMHDKGWLETSVHPDNRREHITTLTPKGKRLADEAVRILNEYHRPMFERVSPKRLEQLLETLVILHDEACRGNKPGACQHELFN